MSGCTVRADGCTAPWLCQPRRGGRWRSLSRGGAPVARSGAGNRCPKPPARKKRTELSKLLAPCETGGKMGGTRQAKTALRHCHRRAPLEGRSRGSSRRFHPTICRADRIESARRSQRQLHLSEEILLAFIRVLGAREELDRDIVTTPPAGPYLAVGAGSQTGHHLQVGAADSPLVLPLFRPSEDRGRGARALRRRMLKVGLAGLVPAAACAAGIGARKARFKLFRGRLHDPLSLRTRARSEGRRRARRAERRAGGIPSR
eukprot:scaffold103827_cov29-Tisochrysis_lutea.AAC.4